MMMSVRRFRHDMIRGIGSCYIELQNSSNIEQYKSTILYGLLNPISFDQQIEGTRSYYLYELVKNFKDDLYFLDNLISRLQRRIPNEDLFIHLIEHLVPFAQDGYIEAKDELYRQYRKHIAKPKFSETDGIKLDLLCVGLLRVNGLKFLRYHIKEMQDKTHKISSDDLGWFHYNIVQKYKEKGTELIRQVYPEYTNEVKYKKDRLEYNFENLLKYLDSNEWNRKLFFYSRMASSYDIERTIDYLLECQIESHIRRVLELLSIGLNNKYRLNNILDLIGQYDSEMDELIYKYCSNVEDPLTRELGYTLVNTKKYRALGLQMIVRNYQSEDKNFVKEYTKKVRVDYRETEDWFHLYARLLELFNSKKRNLPDELLFYIYHESLTSYYREWAFDIMKKKKLLSEEIVEEATFDSDYDISKKAKRYLKKFE